MEMGPPPNEDITQDQTHPSSLLLHASKSESNLFSFHSDPNSRTCSLNTANSIHGISGIKTKIEEMVTSTPQAPSGPSAQNDDEKFRTPQRGDFEFFNFKKIITFSRIFFSIFAK